MNNAAKNVDIQAINLSVLHNYVNNPIKNYLQICNN